MAQFMGYCKSRAQSIIFINRTASRWITKGSQFSKAYWEEKNKDLLEKAVVARIKTCSQRGDTQQTHLRYHICHELCRYPV